MKTGTIILAAGNSSRLGKPKQLINYRGTTLLQRITNIALKSTNGPVLIVEGAGTYELSAHPRLRQVGNPEWEKGMGSSLKLGLKTLEKVGPPDQLLVLLSDQPMVSAGLIESLFKKKKESCMPIVASFYQGSPGVPVVFEKTVFEKLKAIPDEGGAKKLLISNSELLALVKFEAGNIDIDSPEDLEAFNQSNWEHFNN